MIGRREFSVAGLSAMALAALETSASAQKTAQKPHAQHGAHDDHLEACAKACSDCQRECDSCATHCAHMLHSGKNDHITTLETCQDCADVCAAAAHIVARSGPFALQICDACAEICAGCGKACEQFPDDEHMKHCAEECRKCEKACRDMKNYVAHRHTK